MLQNSEQNSKQGTDNKVEEIEVENIKSLARFFSIGGWLTTFVRGSVDFLDTIPYSPGINNTDKNCEGNT
jgi:hypothetical protein